jgi:hypothetical protein
VLARFQRELRCRVLRRRSTADRGALVRDPVDLSAGQPARPRGDRSRPSCSALRRGALPLYILHDFDVSGFGIAKTLTSDSRYKFRHTIARVFDLGLRLAEIEALSLDNEEVAIGKNYDKVGERLRINGATNAEIAYLLDGEVDDNGAIVSGDRVELNAMTSDVLVAFVERKLIEAEARKVVPAPTLMTEAYRAFVRERLAQPVIERWLARLRGRSVAVPGSLEAEVRTFLAEHPAATWDAALRQIAGLEDEG